MSVARRLAAIWRGQAQRWAPASYRRRLWNRDFASGTWDYLDSAADDPIYTVVVKWLNGGRLLDLGCGAGNTAAELPDGSFDGYVGVDISDEALVKAAARSATAGRADRTTWEQGDLMTYRPTGVFDVILFRESLYYLPDRMAAGRVNQLCTSLKPGGVVIVRIFNRVRHAGLVASLVDRFEVRERHELADSESIILVLAP
jgi:SAM-dependent methyltransferase